MHIPKSLAIAALAGLVALPATALADLHVAAAGFHRIVTETSGGSCSVRRMDGGTSVRCPDGARGTMTVYQYRNSVPVCEVDFWYSPGAGGTPPWRVQLSHQSASTGTCVMHWNGDILNLALQPNHG